MKKTKKTLKLSQIYSYSEQDHCYIAQISLDSYSELFNGWDAAPLKRRDLEPDLLDFIERIGIDIPLDEEIKLVFSLPEELKDDVKQNSSKEAIYQNFFMIRHFINQELKKNNRKIFTYIGMGILFLSITYFFQTLNYDEFPFSILFEGLFIGGWVMFWEAFSLFFFTGNELRLRRKRYIRFSNSTIEFQYR